MWRIRSPYLVITLAVALGAFCLTLFIKSPPRPSTRLFTAEELGIYNGSDENLPILLAVLGKLNLLSFAEEAEEEEKALTAWKGRIKSSHDVLHDRQLLKDEKTRELQLSVQEAVSSKKHQSQELAAGLPDVVSYSDDDDNDEDDNEATFDVRMRRQILKKRTELGDLPSKRSDPEVLDDKPNMRKLSINKKGIGSEARLERMANPDSDMQLLGNADRERLLKKRRLQGLEDDLEFLGQ
ncbi:Peptidyl-prolyl cis-trans isomerase CYP57-like protein [Drosera capensis]